MIYVDGGWTVEGGTSASTPLVAGVVALIEAKVASKPRLGLLTPSLYAMAASGHRFNDVVKGTIDYLGTGGGLYPTTAGYDMATGLGSPIATAWAAAFLAPPSAAPTGIKAVAAKLGAQVSWKAPSTGFGLPVTGYVVTTYLGTVVKGSKTFTSPATTEPITGLQAGQRYTFRVAARDAGGTGTASALSSAVVPFTVPGAPTGVTATAGTASAVVHWVPPAANGFSVILSYTATAYLGSVAQTETCNALGALAKSCTISGLSAARSYTFRVVATNAAGSGPGSSASKAVTPHVALGSSER